MKEILLYTNIKIKVFYSFFKATTYSIMVKQQNNTSLQFSFYTRVTQRSFYFGEQVKVAVELYT